MKPSEIISKGIELLGTNGENWGQGAFYDDGKFCMLGCLRAAATGATPKETEYYFRLSNYEDVRSTYFDTSDIVEEALQHRTGYSHIPSYNDTHGRKFAEVKEVMCDALKLALKKEESRETE